MCFLGPMVWRLAVKKDRTPVDPTKDRGYDTGDEKNPLKFSVLNEMPVRRISGYKLHSKSL